MDKSEDRPMSRNILRTLLFLMIGGLGGICVYAFQAPNVTTFFSIVGVGTLIAGASLLGGGTLGFLFGIPRTNLLSDKEKYTPNTNIEQISDWLTKIIVGVGLTQITKVPAALEGLSVTLAPALGGFASSPVFSITIVLYFLLCGFLYGWLWTRLYLTIAIKESENPDKLAKESAGLYTIEDGLPEEAKGKIQEQRLKVEEQLATLIPDTRKAQQQLIQFAQEYERIRDTMPFGSERTSRMSALVGQV